MRTANPATSTPWALPMHYYKRHIGDYAKDTGHLTALEHGVYTLLLDWYYTNERPIPAEKAIRIARGNREETESVLSEFFHLSEEGWRHHRADREIAEYHVIAQVNRANGKLGGRPPKTHSVSESEPIRNPNHKPLTINHETERAKAIAPPAKRGQRLAIDWEPSDDDVAFATGLRVDWRREADAFRDYWLSESGSRAAKLDWSAAWRNWVRRSSNRLAVKSEAPKSKGIQALEAIEEMKHGMVRSGNRNGDSEALLLEAPGFAFGGNGARDRRGVD